MSVNYDALMLGSNIQLTDKVTIYVPTIEELVNRRDDGFSLYQRVFAISVRELFSGMPEEVDKIEESYPTFGKWLLIKIWANKSEVVCSKKGLLYWN